MAGEQVIISLVQSGLFVLLGPTILFFGQAGEVFVNFVQAMLASGWIELIAAFKAMSLETLFTALNLLVMWISGTLALGTAATASKKLKLTMKGMVLFYLVADVPMKMLGDILFMEVAGCTEIGKPTLEFPKGMPQGGCSPDDKDFITALYVSKGLTWFCTILGGFVANILAGIIGPWSVAMSGSTLAVKSVTETILTIGMNYLDPDTTNTLATSIAGVELALIYGLAGAGFIFQKMTSHYVMTVKKGDPPPEIKGIRKVFLCGPMLFILKYLLKFDMFLKSKIMEGGKAMSLDSLKEGAMNAANDPGAAMSAMKDSDAWAHVPGAVLDAGKDYALKALEKPMSAKLKPMCLDWPDVLPVLDDFESVEEIKAEGEKLMADPKAYLEAKSKDPRYKTLGVKLGIASLKPLIEPAIKEVGLLFEDIAEMLFNVLQEFPDIDSMKAEGQKIVSDAKGYLEAKVKVDERYKKMGKKLALFTIGKMIAPGLKKVGLVFADVLPILEALDTMEAIKAEGEKLLGDPQAYFENKVKDPQYKNIGKKMGIFVTKPLVEPDLKKIGLKFEDILPIFDMLDTLEAIKAEGQKMLADPKGYLEEKCKTDLKFKDIGKKLVLGTIKIVIEPGLKKVGLMFLDVLPILDSLDTMEAIKAEGEKMLADPQAYFETKAKDPTYKYIGKKLAVFGSKPVIEPPLKLIGLEYEDVVGILTDLEADKLKEEAAKLSADPKAYLEEKVKTDPRYINLKKKLTLSTVKPVIEPALPPLGLAYEDVVPVLMDLEQDQLKGEAEKMAANPKSYLEAKAKSDPRYSDLEKKMTLGALKPVIDPALKKLGLAYEEVVPVLMDLKQDKLKGEVEKMAADPKAFLMAKVKSDPRFSALKKKLEALESATEVVAATAEEKLPGA